MESQLNKAQRNLACRFGWNNRLQHHWAILNPQVSVIIPSYNCLEYLPRALRSVQMQNVKDIEVIVLDDGSKDNSWEYLQLAASCDRRIKPTKLSGVGVARARNVGLNLAKGTYIAFLDADDHWGPGKLQRQLAFHQSNPQATLSFSNYLHFTPTEQSLGDCFTYWPKFSRFYTKYQCNQINGYKLLGRQGLGAIFAENVIGTSCVMINPRATGNMLYFDEQLRSAEDWDYWLRAALNGPIGCTDRVEMSYLMRPDSESSKTKLRLKFMAKIQCKYGLKVALTRPLALLTSLSRLLTGYAEYYRNKQTQGQFAPLLKSTSCHFLACLLSPTTRLFRALVADVCSLTRIVGTNFYFANKRLSKLQKLQ